VLDAVVDARHLGVAQQAVPAAFRVDVDGETTIYAIDNFDPISHANVMARGIIGTDRETIYVASPLKKERYDLETGACLTVHGVAINTWPIQISNGLISVGH
jgi:nitrite reductase (NADH) small subunit